MLKVTSLRRQIVMAVLLALAAAGAAIRYSADNPSTLRDIGTLLLVLWIPAVGNLIGFAVRKLPHSTPPSNEFPAHSPFAPQLRAELKALPLPAGFTLDPLERRCTVIVGRRGFTCRLAQPLAQALAAGTLPDVAIEALRPALALPHLPAGTEFHLLVETTAVAKGRVANP